MGEGAVQRRVVDRDAWMQHYAPELEKRQSPS